MLSSHHRSRHLLCAAIVVLFAGAALLALGPTQVAASNAAVVQSGDQPTINATQTYEFDAPHPDGNVSVEVVVPAEEVVENATLRIHENSAEETVVSSPGFEATGAIGQYRMLDTGQDARLEYRLDLEQGNQGYQHGHATWASLKQAVTTPDTEVDGTTYRYNHSISVTGEGVARGGLLLLGAHERVRRSTADGSVTVARPASLETANLSNVADDLVTVNDRRAGGELDEHTLGLAVPSIPDAGGRARNEYFIVTPSPELDHASHTWYHEYFHTLDGVQDGEDMAWYSEGYANYGAHLAYTRSGYWSYGQFQNALDNGQNRSEVLADQVSSLEDVNYAKGSLVLVAIDRQIRTTDGDETLDDVVEDMHAEERVSLSEFLSFVADAGNQTLANRAGTWINTTEDPELWSRSAHEAAFGPLPLRPVSTDVRRTAGAHDQSVDIGADPAFYPNQTVTVETTVRALGQSRTVDVDTALWDVDAVTRLGDTHETVTVSGQENVTVTHSYVLPSTGTYDLTTTDGLSTFTVDPVAPVNGTVPTDPDGDGQYEDVNGNGKMDLADSMDLYQHRSESAVTDNVAAYDFSGNGGIDLADVADLFQETTA